MSLYTKALKHIDMSRVKELCEEKIKRKKIAEEIREQIREELRNLNSPEFSNWRYDIDESMTTSDVFSTTLPAQGDVDLVNVDVSNADTWTGTTNSGTVSASGLSFDQLPSQGDSFTNWSFSNLTSAFDATQVNNLKVTVTTGTGVDAPKSGNPLKVEWFNGTELGLLGTFSAGGGTQIFELPKEANVGDLRIFYSVSSDGSNPYGIYTNEYLVGKDVFDGTMNSSDSSDAMSIVRLGASASNTNKIIFGRAWWIDALSNGNPRGYRVPSDPGGTGFDDSDSLALYNQIISLYGSFSTRGSDLYTITTTNFQRRTPMNVFVSLDSPEATAFIRTDPTMQGLSAEDRKKKLLDMLDAGDEYLLKYLGMIGSKARPSETTMPDSWDQAANNSDTEEPRENATPEELADAEKLETLKNKAPGTHTPAEKQALLDAGLDDFVDGGMKSTDIFGDLATIAGAAAVVKGGLAVAGNAVVQGIVGFAKHTVGTLGTVKTAELISDVVTDKLPGVIGDAKNSGDYNTQLAVKLPISILTGQPQEIKLSDSAKIEQINNVTDTQFEKALQIRSVQKPSAETTVNPTPGLKKQIFKQGSGNDAQGGAEVSYDPKTDTLTITAEKMLRTGLKGDEYDITQGGKLSGGQVIDPGKQTKFGDIPDAKPEVVAKMIRNILNVPGTKEIPAILGSPEYQKILKDPAYLESEVIPRVSKMANDATATVVQGTASNVVALRKALTDIGLLPQSEVEKTGGGYGQVYSQTSYKGNEIPSNLRSIITKKTSSGSGVKDYGNVSVKGVGGSPGQEYIDPNKGKKFVPPPQNFQRPGSPPVKKASNKKKTVVAHYKPKGETIMEKNKKSFKDLTKKIPGYYDGKPAPLGFPMQEPPKMKNGFHPDLVTPEGQKKQSNRYNRLDPQSAKAMPPTGNPHIDKKVRAAAKKPK